MNLFFRNRFLYRLVTIGLLIFSLGFLWVISGKVLSNVDYLPVDDFYNYWKAGQTNGSYFLFTLPWALPLFSIFGGLPYPLSRLLWLLLSITLTLSSVNMIWRQSQGQPSMRWLAWFLAFTFGPTISVLEKGQIGSWILFSICAFLVLIQNPKRDFLSGAVLILAAFKPQLVYLFWPILLFWAVSQKRWNIIIGLFIAMIISSIGALILRHNLLEEYYALFFVQKQAADWATPTIGSYLRLCFGVQYFWMQFIPSILGLIWVIWYWIRHRSNWIWLDQISILLFVSILTSAYAWTYDQVILLPAVLMIIRTLSNQQKPNLLWIFIVTMTCLNLLDLLLHRSLDEFWFGWLAPAYYIWYLAGKWLSQGRSAQEFSA